jgi:CRP/FNR family cyclic AMP-dependent transcriptional regulator
MVVEAVIADSALLGRIPLFSKLTPSELADLTRLLKARKFAPGEPIVFIGDNGTEFYIVQLGKVGVSHPDDAGKEVALAELGPGNFFGEISLLDGGPRTATVRAVSAVTLLCLDRDAFVDFLLGHPAAAVHILTILGARQRELLEKLRGIRNVNEAVDDQQTRLQRTLSRCASIFASEKFLVLNMIFFVVWMVVFFVIYPKKDEIKWMDEPPTFFMLGFMITVEAIVISMFVLNAQRRQAERDRVRGDLEYQVNVKAHIEVMELHRKVDKLLEAAKVKK